MSLLRLRGHVAATALTPSGAWNGAAGSGFTSAEPSDATYVRSTASPKPAAKFLTADRQRLNADFRIGVYADAYGGIASVDFWAENSTAVNVASPSLDTSLDPAGTFGVPGYWVTLSAAAYTAVVGAAFGAVKVYARVNPANGSLQPRVIGPLTLYVSTSAQDHAAYDVGSGQTFATLEAALDQAISDGAKHALINMHGTATTAFPYRLAKSYYAGFDSLCKVVGVGGTHTLGNTGFHGGSFVTNADNYSYLKVNRIEFGPGIKLDMKYCAGLYNGNQVEPMVVRFRGCEITNSIGTVNTDYWNRDWHPDGVTTDGQCYFEFTTGSYLQSPLVGAIHAIRSMWHDTTKSHATGCYFAAWNYVNGILHPALHNYQPAFSITYTGAQAAASISFTGSPNDSTWTFNLLENASIVKSFGLTGTNTDPYFNIEAISAFINSDATFNTNHPGWSATDLAGVAGLNSHRLWSPSPGSNDGVTWSFNSYSNTVVKDGGGSHTITLATSIDYHVDWFQFQGNTTYQNVIHTGNVAINMGFTNGLAGGPNSGLTLEDYVFTNNAFHSAGPGTYQTGRWGCCDHGVFDNNAYDSTDASVTTGGFHVDAANAGSFVQTRQYAGYLDNGAYDASNPVSDSYIRRPSGGALPNSASNTGNVGYDVSTGSIPQLFVDAANGDFRPYSLGPLYSNLHAFVQKYDATGTLRAASDCPGAWSKNAPAPSWPF